MCARATLWFGIFLAQVKRVKVRFEHVVCEYMINWFTIFAVMSERTPESAQDTLSRLTKEAKQVRVSKRIQDQQQKRREEFVDLVDSSGSSIEEISPSKFIWISI